MWILPENIRTCLYAPDMEASISDLKERASILMEQFLWRSKPSQATTWLRRLKREPWVRELSGRILKPSLSADFEDVLISSLEASRANRSAKQEKETQTKTPDTCSPISFEEFMSASPTSLSSKMSKELLAQSSKEITGEIPQERPFCSMSLESWKEWVTEQRQSRRARQKSALLTNGTDGSLSAWPTIAVMDTTGGPYKTEYVNGSFRSYHNHTKEDAPKYGARLRDAVTTKMWPTIAASGAKTGYQNRSNGKKGFQRNLETVVRDGQPVQDKNNTDGSRPESLENTKKDTTLTQKSSPPTESWETATVSTGGHRQKDGSMTPKLDQQVKGKKAQGSLNPRWVETLMGLPVGWVMPSCVNPIAIHATNLSALGVPSSSGCACPVTIEPTSCDFLEME